MSAFAEAGAAISEGQFYQMRDGRLKPAAFPGNQLSMAFIMYGPGTWDCRREDNESWPAYVERTAQTARAQIAGFASDPDPDSVYVDLGWVTEDELALFHLPAYVRTAITTETAQGHSPLGLLNLADGEDGARVRFSGETVECSFYHGIGRSLAVVPANATYLSADGRARDIARITRFASLEVLRIAHVSDGTLALIGQLPRLRVLELLGVKASSLAPLASLKHLEVLDCYSNTLDDYSPLAALTRLRVLAFGLPRASDDLTSLGSLRQLTGLYVGGGAEAPKKVRSFEPVSGLTNLKCLVANMVRPLEGGLHPLASLTNLRELHLTNHLPLEEFAELAAALPDAAGPHRSPFYIQEPVEDAADADCPKCHTCRRAWTLGKPMKRLCPRCDAARLRAHVARWEILVSAARARLEAARRS